MSEGGAKARPLILREGTHYRCRDLRVCCSDLHGLSGLGRTDKRRLRQLGVALTSGSRPGLRLRVDGFCEQLTSNGCSIHAAHGERIKPSMCRRFPFALVATPQGGRVATAHRCPCRTLGARPALEPNEAERALTDRAGRLIRTWTAPERLFLRPRTRISFAGYAELEAELIRALLGGEPPWTVFGLTHGLPPLVSGDWTSLATRYRSAATGTTRLDAATGHFGDAVAALLGFDVPLRARPWAVDFEVAASVLGPLDDPRRIVGDYLADRLWDLSWSGLGSLARGRALLSTLGVVADMLARRFYEASGSPAQAAAEAVMVVELGALDPQIATFAQRMRLPAGAAVW